MRNTFKKIYCILALFAVVMTGVSLTSCSMMDDDVKDLPEGLYVRFKYDHNVVDEDRFTEYIGYINLLVYDEDGHLVAQRKVSSEDVVEDGEKTLSDYGYTVQFTTDEVPPGRYRLVAYGMNKDWDEALQTPGAHYRLSGTSLLSQLKVTLDHKRQGGRAIVDNQGMPLDTLWHTHKVLASGPINGTYVPPITPPVPNDEEEGDKKDEDDTDVVVQPVKPEYVVHEVEFVTVEAQRATYATMSMMCDTNYLRITMRQKEDRTDMFHEQYSVSVIADNATLGWDGTILPGTPVEYTPYDSWTSRHTDDGFTIHSLSLAKVPVVYERMAHYDMFMGRLVKNTDASKDARLVITKPANGATVVDINLPQLLVKAAAQNEELKKYDAQEFIDREIDYHMDIFLRGDTWEYIEITFNNDNTISRVFNI